MEIICDAIRCDNDPLLSDLITRKSLNVNDRNKDGYSLLHMCCSMGSIKCAKVLIEYGCDLNTPDEESGWTPLHKALYFRHFRIALMLIRAGSYLDRLPNETEKLHIADLCIRKDKDGFRPMELLSHILSKFLFKSPLNVSMATPVLAFGKADFTLGVMLPNSSVVEKPKCIESLNEEVIVDICSSKYHSLALTETGKVYSWGHGKSGKLGHGDEFLQPEPKLISSLSKLIISKICVAENHSLALSKAGEVFSWGSDRYGQLGHGGSDGGKIVLVPTKIEFFNRVTVKGIASGESHSLCFTSSNELYSWGSNKSGQLGLRSSELNSNNGVGNGTFHPKRVINFGYIGVTQTSNNSKFHNKLQSQSSMKIIQVCASSNSSLVLIKTNANNNNQYNQSQLNEVYQWGRGISAPTRVSFAHRSSIKRSKSMSEEIEISSTSEIFMPNQLPANIISITAGKYHYVGLCNYGCVYSWGFGSDQLGHGAESNVLLAPQLIESLLPENGGGRIRQISASGNRTCAVSEDGDLFVWGTSDDKGVLGLDASKYQPVPKKISGIKRAIHVSAGDDYTIVTVCISVPASLIANHVYNDDTSYEKLDVNNDNDNDTDSDENEQLNINKDNLITNHTKISSTQVMTFSSVPSLYNLCQNSISKLVNVKNAIQALQMAEMYNCSLLIMYCEEFIRRNFDAILVLTKAADIDKYIESLGWSNLRSFVTKDKHVSTSIPVVSQNTFLNMSDRTSKQADVIETNKSQELNTTLDVHKSIRSIKKKLIHIEEALSKLRVSNKSVISAEQEEKIAKKRNLQKELSLKEQLLIRLQVRESRASNITDDKDNGLAEIIVKTDVVEATDEEDKICRDANENKNITLTSWTDHQSISMNDKKTIKSSKKKGLKMSLQDLNLSLQDPSHRTIPSFGQWDKLVGANHNDNSKVETNLLSNQQVHIQHEKVSPWGITPTKSTIISSDSLITVTPRALSLQEIMKEEFHQMKQQQQSVVKISLSSSTPSGRTVLSPPMKSVTSNTPSTSSTSNNNINTGNRGVWSTQIKNESDESNTVTSSFNLSELITSKRKEINNNNNGNGNDSKSNKFYSGSNNSSPNNSLNNTAWKVPSYQNNIKNNQQNATKTSFLAIQAAEEQVKMMSNQLVLTGNDPLNPWFIERKPRADSIEHVIRQQMAEKEAQENRKRIEEEEKKKKKSKNKNKLNNSKKL
eukprot:gene12214-16363_t